MVQWNHYLVWPSMCNFVFTVVLSCNCPLSLHGLFKIMLTCLSLHACILFYSLTYISTTYVIHMIIIQNASNVAHHCFFVAKRICFMGKINKWILCIVKTIGITNNIESEFRITWGRNIFLKNVVKCYRLLHFELLPLLFNNV